MHSNEPFAMPHMTIIPSDQTFDKVLSNVGATMPCRDIVDQRIVEEVRTGQAYYVKKLPKKNPYGDMWGLSDKSKNEEGFFKYRRLDKDSYKHGIITSIEQMGGFPKYINGIDTKKKVDWTDLKNNHDTLDGKTSLM